MAWRWPTFCGSRDTRQFIMYEAQLEVCALVAWAGIDFRLAKQQADDALARIIERESD